MLIKYNEQVQDVRYFNLYFSVAHIFDSVFILCQFISFEKKSNKDVEEYFESKMFSEGIQDKRNYQNSEDKYLVSENYLRYKIAKILDSRDVTFEKKISVLNLLDSLSESHRMR